jgi:hypothetical protein
MKKTLLTASFAIASVVAMAQATCTPNVSCLPPSVLQGICPDSLSAIALLTGDSGKTMNFTVSIKIPASTTYQGQTVTLDQFAVTEVQVKVNGAYVPLSTIGMNYTGAGTNTPTSGTGPSGFTMTNFCYFPAPAQAGKCVVVSGIPNKVGSFPVRILSKARGTVPIIGKIWADAPQENSYTFTIKRGVTGLTSLEISQDKFGIVSTNPNPFNEVSNIVYNSPSASKVNFTVTNLLGQQIYTSTYMAQHGTNTIEFKPTNLQSGVYLCTITNGTETATQRVVFENKK